MASTGSQNQWSGQLLDFFFPHLDINVSHSISLCRDRMVERTDWVIIYIVLTVPVDLMSNRNFGKTSLVISNPLML